MASMKDPAEKAGLSTAKVSWVLVDKVYVRAGDRDHVPAVVEELNYRPNRVACSLRAHKSNTSGLFFSDIQNHFFYPDHSCSQGRGEGAGNLHISRQFR